MGTTWLIKTLSGLCKVTHPKSPLAQPHERPLLFIASALRGVFTPRPLISIASYLFLYCSLTNSADLVRHVGICIGLLLQRILWPISFNPRPLSRSQTNAESRCKNTNVPKPLSTLLSKSMRLLTCQLKTCQNGPCSPHPMAAPRRFSVEDCLYSPPHGLPGF